MRRLFFLVIFIHPFENSGGYFFRGRLFWWILDINLQNFVRGYFSKFSLRALGLIIIIDHRTFESTFVANNINDNTCCASSNSRRFSLFFSIAPSVKKKLIRADWNFCSLQSIYESETCTCNTGAWEAIGSKSDRPFIFRLQPGLLKFVGLLCAEL